MLFKFCGEKKIAPMNRLNYYTCSNALYLLVIMLIFENLLQFYIFRRLSNFGYNTGIGF